MSDLIEAVQGRSYLPAFRNCNEEYSFPMHTHLQSNILIWSCDKEICPLECYRYMYHDLICPVQAMYKVKLISIEVGSRGLPKESKTAMIESGKQALPLPESTETDKTSDSYLSVFCESVLKNK